MTETSAAQPESDVRSGFRKGLPFVLPTAALGISFGVLAEPLMGQVAPIVMSVVVFAGAAQFAALGVLVAGGGAGAAILAGLLMNARFLPMGFAFAPSLRGRALRRATEGQAGGDAAWGVTHRRDRTFGPRGPLGAANPPAGAGGRGGPGGGSRA